MSHPPSNPDAATLLERFFASGRSEGAFRDLATALGGLAYGSALRRTGQPQIAEEVAQNVLAILARKAGSLRGHPSLSAWIFQTTQYEAAKAMRAEHRRQRKHASLAEQAAHEATTTHAGEDAEAWREALPVLDESLDRLPEKDRRLVLERFFEERPYSEIARRTGSTEAACKMRLKRALEKLSGLLRSRGVTLSASALSAGLAGALTSPASAALASAMAPQALAASGSVGVSTIAANSIYTMSTIKSSTISAAAVIAMATGPFLWQQSTAGQRARALADLTSQREALEVARVTDASRLGAGLRPAFQAPPPRTIKDILAFADQKVDARQLMDALMEVMMTQDMVGMVRLLLPISNLSPEDYQALLDEISAHPGNQQMKQMALEMIGSLTPVGSPKETMERMMKLGLRHYSYSNLMSKWATKEPEAAMAWYREKLAAGELVGKGVHDRPESALLAELIGSIGKTAPAKALELFNEFRIADDTNGNVRILAQLATSLAAYGKSTGDFSALEGVLENFEDNELLTAVQHAANAWSSPDQFNDGKAFIERNVSDARVQAQTLAGMASAAGARDVAAVKEAAGWLMDNVPPEQRDTALGSYIDRTYGAGTESIEQWIATEEPEIRDMAYAKLAQTAINRTGNGAQAMEIARKVQDPQRQEQALAAVAERWLQFDYSAASKALAPEWVESHNAARAPNLPQKTEALSIE
ncbi:MAG: RNA polymerase sigma factor [Verrucomicrobiales bacterium]